MLFRQPPFGDVAGAPVADVFDLILAELSPKGYKEIDRAHILEPAEDVKQFDRESDAFAASARLFDDGLIDPRDTRKVLGYTLSVCQEGRARKVQPNSFGVARL